MKRTLLPLLALSAAALAHAQGPTTLSGSLFNDGVGRGLIGRRTASKKGDILTILVSEVMKGSYSASTTTSKKDSTTIDKSNLPLVDLFANKALNQILSPAIAAGPRAIINAMTGAQSVGGSSSMSGSGTSTTTGDFSGTLSVVVTEVDANGNLHIEGHRDVRVNKETQRLTLVGIVRVDDISADNTVPSSKVANADIKADGKGAVAEKTKRGIFSRILEWLL